MRRRVAALVVTLELSTVACPGAKSAPAGDAAPTASTLVATAPAATASTSLAAPAAQAPSRWSGTYACQPASLYVPDGSEWSGVKWRGDDAGDGVGQGTLALSIEPASRRVEGTLDGVVGDARIVGTFADGTIAASVARKSPSDRGFTGTLLGTVSSDNPSTMRGTMRLSLGDGRLIREGTFTATRGTP